MTEGELRFYLREIHSYWTTPRIAAERVTELRDAQLIECSPDAVTKIRLTGDGARKKASSRRQQQSGTSGLSLVRRLGSARRGKRLPPPRPLV